MEIFTRYKTFLKGLPVLCAELKWNPQNLPFVDFSRRINMDKRESLIIIFVFLSMLRLFRFE